MLDQGTSNNNSGFIAAFYGREAIIRLILDQGTNDYNRAMARSAFYGHESIVRLMLDRGADNYNEAMKNAARTGHEAIVGLMLEKVWMLDMSRRA